MRSKPRKTLVEVAREIGRYPLEAFEFLEQGLDFTVQRIHGPPDPVLRDLAKWLDDNHVELDRLPELLRGPERPAPLAEALEQLGDEESILRKMNRHVSGEDLCWGLRDLALRQWGPMASVVLRSWGIRSTMDFGRMVFALVENGLLQKQPGDRMDDFKEVFDFDAALDQGVLADAV